MEIIFESETVVVINKPAGISVHGVGKENDAPTVADWFAKKYPKSKHVGEPAVLSNGITVERPGIVHRLDRDTSGCLILAKTQESYTHLKRQFKKHAIQKEYHAFVYGMFKEERGIITTPIGRSKSSIQKRATGNAVRGETREAQTVYKVIKTGTAEDTSFSLVAFFPKTGRTHQIRVHALSRQHAIVADSLYAPRQKKILGFGRQALHAYRIGFHDMTAGDKMIIASYPPDFEKAIASLPSGKRA